MEKQPFMKVDEVAKELGIYNAPLDYARLVLEGDVGKYLKEVTEYKRLD
ncbi:MAG: hypothetical protein IK132_00250 [Clostridia bacterium]|nr:hypothetical protein [Clostridia bacterium]